MSQNYGTMAKSGRSRSTRLEFDAGAGERGWCDVGGVVGGAEGLNCDFYDL